MPDLFSSKTGDSKYSLFLTPREIQYINSINTELLEIVANQNFNYWPVEVEMSEADELYGESEKKIPRNPIKVFGWIQLDEPETITNNFGAETRRRLELYLHIDRLTEVGVYPKKGDYIEWDSQFFEITELFVNNQGYIHGLTENKVGVTVRCISTRENIFAPRKDINIEEEQSTQDPY